MAVKQKQNEPRDEKRTARETGLAPCRRCRILIADDEKSVREVLTYMIGLHIPNCRFDAVVNGAEAVEAFRDVRAEVVVIDIRMPVMDGEEAVDEIMRMCQENRWEPPSVIFITAFDPPERIEKLVASDPRHCILRKPIVSSDMISALQGRLSTGASES